MAADNPSTLCICTFVLIFCTYFLTISASCNTTNDNLYIIRSKGPNGLVLDATEPNHVTVQHFSGSDAQLWKFQPASRPGSYYVVNEYHGKVLDMDQRDDGYLHMVVTDNKLLQQQWSFSVKGQIINAAGGQVVDVDEGRYTAGNFLKAWQVNDWCLCQQFLLQKKV